MCLSVFLFAFATIICWAHYGKESLISITKRKGVQIAFVVIFCAFVVIGAISAPDGVWLAADLALGVMTIINIPVLVASFGEVKEETERFFYARGIDKQGDK